MKCASHLQGTQSLTMKKGMNVPYLEYVKCSSVLNNTLPQTQHLKTGYRDSITGAMVQQLLMGQYGFSKTRDLGGKIQANLLKLVENFHFSKSFTLQSHVLVSQVTQSIDPPSDSGRKGQEGIPCKQSLIAVSRGMPMRKRMQNSRTAIIQMFK